MASGGADMITAVILASDSDGHPMQALFFVAVVGGWGFYSGMKAWRRRWLIVDTPTSACAAVFVGRNEVIGHARPHVTLAAPVSQHPCVWFEWELERWQRGGKNNRGRWVTVEKRSSVAPFWVMDDTGGVLVRPRGAEIQAPQVFRQRARRSGLAASRHDLRAAAFYGDPIEDERTAAEGGVPRDGTNRSIASLGNNHRITERRLDVGQQLYVLGQASMRPDVVALEFAQRQGEERLFISHKSEEALRRTKLVKAVTGLLLAFVALLAFPPLLHETLTYDRLPDPDAPSTWEATGGWVVLLGALYLGIMLLVYWVRVYNRLVAVKQQAATAWSLIDVALRRRHDLIPNLVEVAKRYAAHEREVMEAVAGLRMGQNLAPAEALPDDATLRDATDLDHSERRGSRHLLALGEAYPNLKADELFRDLADRITESENQVAYARRFYNDAITVLRDRRQTFPGVVLASLVTTPSWNLFEAEEPTYTPPVVTLVPDAGSTPPPPPPPAPVSPGGPVETF